MAEVIWVTGPAACGKSTLAGELAGRIPLLRPGRMVTALSDESLLLEAVSADTDHLYHSHPFGDKRFIADASLFDDGVREISRRLTALIAADADAFAVVELARGRRATGVDVTYARAVEFIDPDLWRHSTVIALAVPWEVRHRRNVDRIRDRGHGTAEDVMEALYRDARPADWGEMGITVHLLDGRASPGENARRVLSWARIASPTP